MLTKKRIRVLVVDDSLVFREILSKGISSDSSIDVVATANDPFEARDKIIEFEPDVITCDIEMQKMNGIEFISRLLPQYPLPVVVVSSVSEAVFEALSAGAVDFVTKPDVRSVNNVAAFLRDLIIKIKIASLANLQNLNARHLAKEPEGKADSYASNKIIAIGASTGGTEAIYHVLKALPPSIPGIVVVQHIPPIFSKMFADRLSNSTQLTVKEARNGDQVEKGQVLIAPGNAHMKIKKAGERFIAEVFQGDKVNGHCPSVDVLFESVAEQYGSHAIGIILTGMGYDGAKGLLSMRKKGARTIGQDEKSSVVYGMPKVAYNIGAVEKQAPLNDIPNILYTLLR